MHPIPAVAHLIWVGGSLSDLGWLAVQMALDVGGFHRVKLWSQRGQLQRDERIAALLATGRVDLCDRESLDEVDEISAELDRATRPGVAARLNSLERELTLPAAKADLWRLRILWEHGGVYLDTDALCLQDLTPLRRARAFVGTERIALPAALYRSHNPLRWARAGALIAVRHAISLRLGAGRRFEAVEHLYDIACNNAVMAAKPRHPLFAHLLHCVADMPRERAMRLYELGPRLLEEQLGDVERHDVEIHPPLAFYPLPPEVCADYVTADPQGKLGQSPHPDAWVAHLYDSVLTRRLGQPVDLAWLRAHRDDTLLGRMVARWL